MKIVFQGITSMPQLERRPRGLEINKTLFQDNLWIAFF